MLGLPSQVELRERLHEMVLRDLLGPAGGPDEEVAEASVRERYLVGALAARRVLVHPEEHEGLAVQSGEGAEDGEADAQVVEVESLFPSSIGLTFAVEGEAETLRVVASWGKYVRRGSEVLENKDGEPVRVWKRVPQRGEVEVPLRVGELPALAIVPDEPKVVVRGLARRTGDDDAHWIVSLFLVNTQDEPRRSPDAAWVFQPELEVWSPDRRDVFVRRELSRAAGAEMDPVVQAEAEAMAMIYRHRQEFAVGHGVGVRVLTEGARRFRAVGLVTRVVPAHDVPKVTTTTAADVEGLAGLVLDMKELAQTPREQLDDKLKPLPKAYGDWIEAQRARVRRGEDGLERHRDAARKALDRCERIRDRIHEGVMLLASDPNAAEAFRFANRAMWLQRVHGIYAEQRRRGAGLSLDDVDVPQNRTWYLFQLAFLLLNLPGVTNLHHRDRTHERDATADLLWFPTGGGKTEAYLGVAAYTMGLRRLQGKVSQRDGEYGVAVLMRYTLRLLTLQQFQRAASLICACEVIRREAEASGEARWGREPFRIGLWVGMKTTPNYTTQSEEALKQLKAARRLRPVKWCTKAS